MKNIITFKNFKRLNEEAEHDPRAGSYGGGGDTYFANVKGNFAGAENTLVGSAVIKLFNFVKRKGFQVMLYTWYKPNLYREYMSGLMRYIVRNQMNLPKAKSEYNSIVYQKNEDGKLVATTEQVKLKITLPENIKAGEEYSLFKIGTEIKTENGESPKDGYYNLSEYGRMIKIENGKISQIDSNFGSGDLDKSEKSSTEESKPVENKELSEKDKEKSLIDKDVYEYVQIVKSEYNKVKEKGKKIDPKYTKTIIKEIDSAVSFFNSNIVEMRELLLNNELQNDIVQRIKYDLTVYTKNTEYLLDLRKEINTPIKSPEKVKEENVIKGEGYEINISELKLLIEELDITGAGGDVKNVARTAGQIKVGDVKVTKNKRIGDELNYLSQVDIDLNDPNFTKQFDDPKVKEACTKVVLEGKPEICKIQLGAERLYMNNEGKVDRKLQNNWLKMVETVKSQFSKFMNTDSIDPIFLRSKMNTDEVNKYKSDETSRINMVANNVTKNIDASKNNILIKVFKKIPGSYAEQGDGDFGIVDLNGKSVLYNLNNINLGAKYYTYRLIGSVSSGITSIDKIDNLPSYLDKAHLPQIFVPKELKKSMTDGSTYQYRTTFIVGRTKHFDTSGNNNDVNVIFVFSKNEIDKLDETTIKNCLFYFKGTDGNDHRLSSEGTSDKKLATMKLVSGEPWTIKSSYTSSFGLTDKDKIMTIQVLSSTYKDLIKFKS